MWIKRDITKVQLDARSGITIGAFDGVHRGHQALIGKMSAEARKKHLQPIVITFDPLPGQVLGRDNYGLLTTLEERIAMIGQLGVAGLVVLPFDEALRNTSAESFLDLIVVHLHPGELWVGPDFRLGRDREGDLAFLKQIGRRRGFEVYVFHSTVMWEGKPVRSTRIRQALREGRLEEANGCLGYPYSLTGTVERGDGRGQKLGFPTANLRVPPERLLPADGVYVCSACVRDHTYGAVTNVGTRPTFDDGSPTVEAHLLDFSGDIYGARMQLRFLKRLRPEKRFPSMDALIQQIKRDKAQARAWLKGTRLVERKVGPSGLTNAR